MFIHVLEYLRHNLNGGEKRRLFFFQSLIYYFLLFSVSGDSGDQWQRGAVSVGPAAEFYFIIEGN